MQATGGSDFTTATNKTLVAQYFTDQLAALQNPPFINSPNYVFDYLKAVKADDSTVLAAAENTAHVIQQATGVSARVAQGAPLAADSGELTLRGTAQADHFVLDELASHVAVLNFASAGGDQLVLSHAFNGLRFDNAADVLARSHVDGGNTVIDLGQGHAVTLVGVATLGAHDIVLS
jgi:hypothetical protein